MSDHGKIYRSLYYRLNTLVFNQKNKSVFNCPRHYITFSFEKNEKKALFLLYKSINIETHINDYLALSMMQETIYFFCRKGAQLFQEGWLKSKRPPNIFWGYEHILIRAARKIARKISYGN